MRRRLVYYLCILTGGVVAIYAQAGEQQNIFVLVGGLLLLMFGLYSVSKGISPKKEEEISYIKTEKDDEESI